MPRLIKIISYIVYLLLALLIIPEVSLRVLGFHGESDYGRLIKYDEALGWSFIPNTDIADISFEWKVRYHINEDGFREKSGIKEKTEGIYRILILGDSFTEGFGIRQNKRFSFLTESLLNKNNRKVEIINLGVRGYNLAQYYGVFQTAYKKYKPDLVIIAAILADLDVVTDACPLAAGMICGRPHYHLQDGQLILDGIPVFKPYRHELLKNDKLELFKERYLRHSAAWAFLKALIARNHFLKKIYMPLKLEKDFSKYPEYKKLFKHIYNVRSDPMLYDKEMNEKISVAILKDMFDTFKGGGGKLLVFLLTDDKLNTNARFYKRLSDDTGFFYASFPELSDEYKKNKRKYHFNFDLHFNERGNALVAESLADFLKKNVLKEN